MGNKGNKWPVKSTNYGEDRMIFCAPGGIIHLKACKMRNRKNFDLI